MKTISIKLLGLLGLLVSLSACATETKSQRNPSSEIKVIADKYEDAKVFFCSADSAVVSIDPNRCNEAKANGSKGCLEVAGYNSGRLKIVESSQGSELVNEEGQVLFTVLNSGNEFQLVSNGKKKEEFIMTWSKLTPEEIEMYRKYLGICR